MNSAGSHVRVRPEAIEHLKLRGERLSALIETVGPIEIHRYENPFPYLVHTVIEQMLSAKVASASMVGH